MMKLAALSGLALACIADAQPVVRGEGGSKVVIRTPYSPGELEQGILESVNYEDLDDGYQRVTATFNGKVLWAKAWKQEDEDSNDSTEGFLQGAMVEEFGGKVKNIRIRERPNAHRFTLNDENDEDEDGVSQKTWARFGGKIKNIRIRQRLRQNILFEEPFEGPVPSDNQIDLDLNNRRAVDESEGDAQPPEDPVEETMYADFRGKIKRIRIKKRRQGSYSRVSVVGKLGSNVDSERAPITMRGAVEGFENIRDYDDDWEILKAPANKNEDRVVFELEGEASKLSVEYNQKLGKTGKTVVSFVGAVKTANLGPNILDAEITEDLEAADAGKGRKSVVSFGKTPKIEVTVGWVRNWQWA